MFLFFKKKRIRRNRGRWILGVQGQPSLQSEFQDSQDCYTEKPEWVGLQITRVVHKLYNTTAIDKRACEQIQESVRRVHILPYSFPTPRPGTGYFICLRCASVLSPVRRRQQ